MHLYAQKRTARALAMVIGTMLNATDILHATPKLYVMPPSDELGAFKAKYGNLLGYARRKACQGQEGKGPIWWCR